MENQFDFKDGELIVPNENMAGAFYYYKTDDPLILGISYRVATSAERASYEKKRLHGSPELQSLNRMKDEYVKRSYKAQDELKNERRGDLDKLRAEKRQNGRI